MYQSTGIQGKVVSSVTQLKKLGGSYSISRTCGKPKSPKKRRIDGSRTDANLNINSIRIEISLLRDGSPEAKTNAAKVLGNLAANNPANQTKIVEAGALPDLIGLLRDENPQVKTNAVRVLGILALNNPANQTKILEAVALPDLIGLLTDEVSNVRQYAAGVLMEFGKQ